MRLRLLFLLLLTLLIPPTHAQDTRDYAITSTSYTLKDNNASLSLEVTVENQGTDGVGNVSMVVYLQGSVDREVYRAANITPLAAGESGTFITTPLATNDFPSGEQTFRIEVGIDAVEPPSSSSATDNISRIVVPIPLLAPNLPSETEANTPFIAFEGTIITVAGRDFERNRILIYALAFVVVLVLLYTVYALLRSLFRKPPRFDMWQPPYAVIPALDQSSDEGRRQAWQQHAQNNLLLAAPMEGNVHPIKILMGTDGTNLSNWKFVGLRLSQYDNYGRIARSQVIARKNVLNRLNKVIKKQRFKADDARLQRLVRPIAKAVVKQLKRKVKQRTALLPIAFDMRFEGRMNECAIVFELYQFQEHNWYRIDRWQPQMLVLTQRMQENFTYTMHGKTPIETMSEYYQRIEDDIIWILIESLRVSQPQETPTSIPEPYDVPDTLAGMEPISPNTTGAAPAQA